MPTIPFQPPVNDSIRELLDSMPDIDDVTDEELPELREQIEDAIHALDQKEPRNMNSEAYEEWGDLHEELEDILDEILDRLEEL